MSDVANSELTLLNDRFLLGSLLGQGGMADVYRATDLQHGRAVAIKLLRADVVDLIGVERFRREIALTAAFTHPHILGLLESGEAKTSDGVHRLYYVMPLIDGETLRDRLARQGHLSLRDSVRILREVLEALRYAHEHGVIHRDIKPANILLSGGHAVVADFGIARPVVRPGAGPDEEPTLTVSGVTVGTPAYMSPEQALAGATVDIRSDLYAAGCVFYEMLTGRAPFDASTGQAVIARKMNGAFVPPSAMRSGLPPMIDDITVRALRQDPADRFGSADEFLATLEVMGETGALRSLTTSKATAFTIKARFRRWHLVALLGGGVAVAAWLWARAVRSQPTVAANGIDPARVAVLPFENLSPDTSLIYVANGITSDLIDELAQVHALTVVSKNGVTPLLGKSIGVDSMARVLRVGSVITGDVRPNGDGVSVTVRLLDGATGQQVASRDTSGTMQELLRVRSGVVEDVARFLRERLGEQVRISSTQKRANNAQAWELVERVRSLRLGELTESFTLSPADRNRRFQHADSIAKEAARLDPSWPEPLVERAQLSKLHAFAEIAAGQTGSRTVDAGRDTALVLYRDAVQFADQALARDANYAEALHVRGAVRSALWGLARDTTSDSLRLLAERDLRAAIDSRRDLSLAWNDLGILLSLSGDFAEAEHDELEALRADEYLSNAPEFLARLQIVALAAEHTQNAVRWCAEGRRRYPTNQLFFACELTTLGWTGDKASDVGKAWQLLEDAEKRYTADILQTGWAYRRLFVAAAAARAGLRDSASAIVARTRANPPPGASTLQADYAEAHVRALLGQTDEALRLLERYLKQFPIQRRQVGRLPWFRSLRADPRFVRMTAAP